MSNSFSESGSSLISNLQLYYPVCRLWRSTDSTIEHNTVSAERPRGVYSLAGFSRTLTTGIENFLRPNRVDHLSVSASDTPHMDHPTGPGSQGLMMHWRQELAARTTHLITASALQDQDGRRFTVLMAACRHRDLFYVVFHQLCCLWSVKRTIVLEIFDSLAMPDAIDFTFDAIQRILNNVDLSPFNLEWFSNFPMPAQEVLTVLPGTTLAFHIARFIRAFSAYWEFLSNQAEAEDQPIARSVLRSSLHCSSPVLQYILFVTSSLQIGIVAVSDVTALDEQFDRDEEEGPWAREETVRQALALEHASFVYEQMP